MMAKEERIKQLEDAVRMLTQLNQKTEKLLRWWQDEAMKLMDAEFTEVKNGEVS